MAATTTRYFDPNVVPVGASGVAPAGPAAASPHDAANAPGRPAARLCGAEPLDADDDQSRSASPKKSDRR